MPAIVRSSTISAWIRRAPVVMALCIIALALWMLSDGLGGQGDWSGASALSESGGFGALRRFESRQVEVRRSVSFDLRRFESSLESSQVEADSIGFGDLRRVEAAQAAGNMAASAP